MFRGFSRSFRQYCLVRVARINVLALQARNFLGIESAPSLSCPKCSCRADIEFVD